MVGSTSIRISWGRSSANRHAPSLGVVAPPSYAQLPGGYPGAGSYGNYDPTGALAGAYGSAPYGSGPADPYAGAITVPSSLLRSSVLLQMLGI